MDMENNEIVRTGPFMEVDGVPTVGLEDQRRRLKSLDSTVSLIGLEDKRRRLKSLDSAVFLMVSLKMFSRNWGQKVTFEKGEVSRWQL